MFLRLYPHFNSTRIAGDGLAYQSLYSALADEKKGYTLGQIKKACENMAEVGLMSLNIGYLLVRHQKGKS